MRCSKCVVKCSIILLDRLLLEFLIPWGPPNLVGKTKLGNITADTSRTLRVLAIDIVRAEVGLRFESLPQIDQTLLELMPALKLVDIQDEPLYAQYAGTLRGQLSCKTANTLRQASTVHCTGLAEPVRSLRHLEPVASIKTWTSISAIRQESTFINCIAPNLQKLQIHIKSPCKNVNSWSAYHSTFIEHNFAICRCNLCFGRWKISCQRLSSQLAVLTYQG